MMIKMNNLKDIINNFKSNESIIILVFIVFILLFFYMGKRFRIYGLMIIPFPIILLIGYFSNNLTEFLTILPGFLVLAEVINDIMDVKLENDKKNKISNIDELDKVLEYFFIQKFGKKYHKQVVIYYKNVVYVYSDKMHSLFLPYKLCKNKSLKQDYEAKYNVQIYWNFCLCRFLHITLGRRTL